MTRCIWVQITYASGQHKKICTPSKVGRQCHQPTFLLMPPDEPNDELDELTRAVNSIIETFIADHPGEELRILADTEGGDREDQLRFAFVETDPAIELPDPS
jgi:hypothetical protein